MNARSAVFLDRDGVLNRTTIREGAPRPPGSIAELEVVPGAARCVSRLRAAGYLTVCVTNQPDIARGLTERKVVDEINSWMAAHLGLDDLRCCPHDDRDGCICRKPQPGLILEAARDAHVALGHSTMVGDRWSDILAGKRAGCRTVLIGDGYGETPTLEPDRRCTSLEDAVEWILTAQGRGRPARDR